MHTAFFRAAAATAFGLAVLGGCASRPQIQVAANGAMPTSGGYVLAEGAPEAIASSFSDRLVERGLGTAGSPAYLVQVSYAERPAGTGLFLPDAEAREWLRAPDLRRKRRAIATLGVTIVETAGGREVFRASASGPAGASPADADWQRLLDAILSAPPAEG